MTYNSLEVSDETLAAMIHEDLKKFAEEWQKDETIGRREPIDAFCDVLLRGGKRLRGILAMRSYYAHGGEDEEVALGAARIFEIIQTSLLIVDDIADRSQLRRGGLSAHMLLASHAKETQLKGNPLRYGEVQAMNIAYAGPPKAITELLNLSVDADIVRRACRHFNRNVVVTINGQIDDVFNEATRQPVSEEAIESVLRRKTAQYTFLSPLELGAQLAGKHGLSKNLETYSIHAGGAYQIADDNISTFGHENETGKGNNDDIREGKQTLLVYYAQEHASREQKELLGRVLGNEHADVGECDEVRRIFELTGARLYAQKRLRIHEKAALDALASDTETDAAFLDYLKRIADYLVNRQA
jgi:geranylgeranyl diphosphate synthase type I